MARETYEDALNEAVQLLIAQNEHSGPVIQNLLDRLHRDPELQRILLGFELPKDDDVEATRLVRDRGVPAVHELVTRATNRLQSGYRRQ